MIALVPFFFLKRWRHDAVYLFVTLLTSALFVYLLKFTVRRVRPWIALGLPPPFHAPTDFSFPSGHATGPATVAAFVLVLAWRRHRAIPLPLYVLIPIAFAVALARVVLGVHWPLDIAVGMMLGAIVGAIGGAQRARKIEAEATPAPTE